MSTSTCDSPHGREKSGPDQSFSGVTTTRVTNGLIYVVDSNDRGCNRKVQQHVVYEDETPDAVSLGFENKQDLLDAMQAKPRASWGLQRL